MTRITRVEIIDENGRSYVSWEEDNDITVSYQDDGRTLKVFVNKVKPKTGEEGALEALEKFQNNWLLGKKCPETKLEIKKLDSVESIKAEIKMLQSKLEFYEELEKTKSPVEEAYKRCYGEYPVTDITDTCWNGNKWMSFVQGYGAAQEDYKVGEFQHLNEEVQEPEENEWKVKNLQDKNWYVDTKTNLKPHWEPKPQNEKEVAEGLKEAFVKAQQTEKWKETQKKIDTPKESWMNNPIDELVDKLMENPPECLRFELSPSLEDRIYKWWNTCFTTHCEWSMEECVEDLLDVIESFLPRSQSSEGSQDIYACIAVDTHNDLLKKIKSKLRNKKDT